MDHHWQPMSIAEAHDRFTPSGVDWWIAGGHAIDLFLGWETRSHADLDIEMFRSDRAVLFDIFKGWDLHVASEGQLLPWVAPEDIDDSVFGIWARSSSDDPWQLEIMFADGDRHEWRFRRDPLISMSGEKLVRKTAAGVPYCTPEVQLLYKSQLARPKDDVDLARCLHRMTIEQRSWLADAVARTSSGHPWIGALAESLERHHE